MKRLVFVLGIIAAGVVVLYAGWRLQRWREAEEEKRLRKIPTLSGTATRHPVASLFPAEPAALDEVDG